MRCPDCDGKGGWGHGSTTEYDYFGRTSTRETTSRFFACDSCHGVGHVDNDTATAIQKRLDDAYRLSEDEDARWANEVAYREIRERREEYEADMNRTTAYQSIQ